MQKLLSSFRDAAALGLAGALCCLTLAACGGGGGGGGSASPAAAAQAASTVTVSGNQNPVLPTVANVAAITVDSGISDIPNMPFVSVKVCTPGTSTCQVIDHILVDTGSWGLRLFASQLSLTLPQQVNAQNAPVAECMQFFNGHTWGPVKLLDLKIAGETAASLPVQLIDPTYLSVPSDCASTGTQITSAAVLGANGIIGLGVFQHDCGARCANAAYPAAYYTCPAGACNGSAMPETLQVANPVPFFATDNNGVLIQLPAPASGGAPSLTGSLVFGIGTQTNNALGSAKVIGVDASQGTFTTTLGSQTYANSIIDSGSTAMFFVTASLPSCAAPNAGYYCPVATTQLSAVLQGVNGINAANTMNVTNIQSQNYPTNVVLPTLAGSSFVDTSTFDWGLPFFYGKNVYAAIEMKSTSGGTGPYFAF